MNTAEIVPLNPLPPGCRLYAYGQRRFFLEHNLTDDLRNWESADPLVFAARADEHTAWSDKALLCVLLYRAKCRAEDGAGEERAHHDSRIVAHLQKALRHLDLADRFPPPQAQPRGGIQNI